MKDALATQTLIPSEKILPLLQQELRERGQTRVLVDGFPRNMDQLAAFEEKVRKIETQT